MLHLWIVSGCIGAGKSAALRAIESQNPSTHICFVFKEGQDKWLFWLEKCRRDPTDLRCRLMLQMEVLAHYQRVTTRICELAEKFPPEVDIHVLVERSPEDVLKLFVEPFRYSFKGADETYALLKGMMALYSTLFPWSIAKRLYIHTPPAICLQRIQKRGRVAEKDLKLEHIESQHAIHEERMANHATIDTTDRTPAEVAEDMLGTMT